MLKKWWKGTRKKLTGYAAAMKSSQPKILPND